MMGGASEDDNAMIWFLQRANGGDILVLRASGSDGYNDYMYSELGVAVNSVETIVFNDVTAHSETYIHQKINQAEAIWFAGGDQWDYVSYWRNTPINSLINKAISKRNIVVGGTSAGMAIQGGFYFSAENGTVTSSTALRNPFDEKVTVDSSSFLTNRYLSNVITDTHYDNPDRKGRHVVFLSRILGDYGIKAKGIACDEYTAVCIDTNGTAKVYGEYPNNNDNAYFIQVNCELEDATPENYSSGRPLVYGGTWENWYVTNGRLRRSRGSQPECRIISTSERYQNHAILVYPNPAKDYLIIKFVESATRPESIKIKNLRGQTVKLMDKITSNKIKLHTQGFLPGTYYINLGDSYISKAKFVIR